jgi:putative transposase
MTEHIFKSHNKTLFLYHLVCPVKYRRKAISSSIAETIKNTCLELGYRYEMNFVEIGTDDDHVHFLIQSVPVLSPTEIVTIVKSITAKKIFFLHPEVKQMLWGGNFWTSGYYMNTVGRYGSEQVISNYVKQQGMEYRKIYQGQLTLFD